MADVTSIQTSGSGPSPTPSKVWLITGASSGLGLALAQRALARGEHVIATARGDAPARFAELVASVSDGERARLRVMQLDVAAPYAEIAHVAQEAVAVWGRVDVVVCNAGVGGFRGVSEEFGRDVFLDHMRVNFLGAVNVINALLPQMRARRDGAVLIVGSRTAYRNEIAVRPVASCAR
ncbi:NAD(P)-binding protein [Auriscalpium vulgare]|uniref:NAD(P)-binding protein n=1 Tax=Auriscalpium vulgare TaxID=40419 RepID=A0ACB8RX70_9AGAM|nr:NAD(P)-binding protein [Auriscalpium vulgare]